jgi:deoxyadenosine/deoxycytidine kinase
MNKIFAVEGNSFSGKTTTVERLEEQFHVPIVHEYDRYANGGINFPHFPPETYEDAKGSIDFFVELETRRSQDAMELALTRDLPVVLDRSPYSCLVFQWTVGRRDPSIPEAYAYSLEKFQRAVEDGNIILPNGLIYLEPGSEDIFMKRVQTRGRVHIDFLNDIETLRLMREWYKKVMDKHFVDDSGIIIQTVEGNIDLTAMLLFEFITNSNDSKLPKNLVDLINI